MKTSIRTIVALGALAASATLASAAPATTPAEALARAQAGLHPGASYSQHYAPHGGYRGYRGYRGGHRRGVGGGAVAAGVIGGLAAGALLGGALSAQAAPPPPAGYYPGPGAPVAAYGGPVPVGNVYGRDPNWVSYCANRYPGFDPVSGTFQGRDGYRYPCR